MRSWADIIFLPCGFFFFLLSFFLAYSQPSQIRCLPYFHAWCDLRIARLKCAVYGSLKIQDAKSPIIRHLGSIAQLCLAISSQLRHISAVGNNLLNINIPSTCSHNMVNFGPLPAEIGLSVWGTPAKFSGFRVLPSLLQRRRSPEANQTLHDVWQSPGLVHYIYTFGGSCPVTEFCPVQNSLYVKVLRSLILAALLHGTPAAGVSQTLRRAWYKEWN